MLMRDHADFTASTRQHELVFTDQDCVCAEISMKSIRKFVYAGIRDLYRVGCWKGMVDVTFPGLLRWLRAANDLAANYCIPGTTYGQKYEDRLIVVLVFKRTLYFRPE